MTSATWLIIGTVHGVSSERDFAGIDYDEAWIGCTGTVPDPYAFAVRLGVAIVEKDMDA